MRDGFLLAHLTGGFAVLAINAAVSEDLSIASQSVGVIPLSAKDDATGALAHRYLGEDPGAVYLIRPDQHVVGRWPVFEPARIEAAFSQATGTD